MKEELSKIGFGGGCHWCTEAIFQSIKGVEKVEQGYVASHNENSAYSEAVIVHFNMKWVKLKTLIKIHLLTHNSTSNHSMRNKYRSAIYIFDNFQYQDTVGLMEIIQMEKSEKFVTDVLPFKEFQPSRREITNYYYSNPEKPFCKTFISPKLKLLMERFAKNVNTKKIEHLQTENMFNQ